MITIEQGGIDVGAVELSNLLGRGLLEDVKGVLPEQEADCKIHGFAFVVDEETYVRRLALLVEDMSEGADDLRAPWWAVFAADELEESEELGKFGDPGESSGDLQMRELAKFSDRASACYAFAAFSATFAKGEESK